MTAFLDTNGLADLPSLRSKADLDPAWFWNAIFNYFDLTFDQPYERVLVLEGGIERPRWCVGGRTNLTLSCLDRHRQRISPDKTAIVWSAEDGATRSVTYGSLDEQVQCFAALLDARGIRPGDVVGLFMPMLPEAVVAFMAIIRVGAIVLPLFSGYGPTSVAERLLAAGARAVATVSVAFRRGALSPMKTIVDRAVELETVIVLTRGQPVDLVEGRDVDWAWEAALMPTTRSATIVEADAPAMLVYTSGTSGSPKGTVHTHCGLMGKNTLDVLLCLDLGAEDRLLWMSDMGWVIGPKSIIGTLLAGATLVIAEGTPDRPGPPRNDLRDRAHSRAADDALRF